MRVVEKLLAASVRCPRCGCQVRKVYGAVGPDIRVEEMCAECFLGDVVSKRMQLIIRGEIGRACACCGKDFHACENELCALHEDCMVCNTSCDDDEEEAEE